jgi:transcriptional regulator with XRE-family HTH domain
MIGKDVCRRLRQIRLAHRLTQAEFAEKVGLSVDAVGKIERQTNVPTMDSLYLIAEGLAIPIADIVSPDNVTYGKHSVAMSSLADYLSTRSDEDIRFVHNLAISVFSHSSSQVLKKRVSKNTSSQKRKTGRDQI